MDENFHAHASRLHRIERASPILTLPLHHAPQQSGQWTRALLQRGVARFRVEFVREDAEQVREVLTAWREHLDGRSDASELAARTGAAGQVGVAQGGMKLLAE